MTTDSSKFTNRPEPTARLITGDLSDFSGLDLFAAVPEEDAFTAAQGRMSAARRRDVAPTLEDIETVRAGAWHRAQVYGHPLDAEGDRLYVLAFEGFQPYVKVGRSTNIKSRIRNHDHTAAVGCMFLFDAWVSAPCHDARAWEARVLKRLEELVNPPKVTRVFKEYFWGLPFPAAVTAAELEQDT